MGLAAAFGLALFLVGCGGAVKQTVTVTQRPDTIASTETAAPKKPAEMASRFPAGYDTVRAQRFDQGRMWTFDNLPRDYFQTRYGLSADSQWVNRARLGALRFGSTCSASFVSERGLIMTNHHCGRQYIEAVSRPDESLLENGFYADSLAGERRAEDLYVEQLVKIEDVTDRIYQDTKKTSDARAQARSQRADRLAEQLTAEAKERNERLRVEVKAFYSGARYKAYTYRRYEDVRLVMAPELEVGYFGGTADNFTYPRFTLDVTFFRAYGADGTPLRTPNHFAWAESGAEEGEAVFAVGNPGATSRYGAVSQLTYERENELPQRLAFLRNRARILSEYVRAHPDSAAAYDLRTTHFSMQNSLKSVRGKLEGLKDPYLIARRAATQEDVRTAIESTDSLRSEYGRLFTEIDQLQQSKRVVARKSRAFTAFSNTDIGSRVLTRAIYGYYVNTLRRRGARAERLQEIREDGLSIEDWPVSVERAFIAERLREIRSSLGASDPTVQRVLQGQTPDQVADSLVRHSALVDSSGFADVLDKGFLNSNDPAVSIVEALAPIYFSTSQQMQDFAATERNLTAQLARVMRATTEAPIAPDANFTLRLSDGVVQGYAYNGTRAPAFTNFYGLLDHYHAYDQEGWALPDRWRTPPEGLRLNTPLNLVATTDISGGSSGSALLNRDLEVVGLIFDSNTEALPNEYLYRTGQGARAIAVDARGILAALRTVYDAEQLVRELTTGQRAPMKAKVDDA
jgi:hypothetical protein